MIEIIKAEEVDVGYDNRTVVGKVNLSGMKGQLICLLGPNGAGKTTILRTITGLLAPVNGTVFINGNDLIRMKKEELAKKMAVVLTEQLSLGFFTVYEIAAMGRYPHINHFGKLKEKDRMIVEKALHAVGALNLRDRYYSELSDGEKQKVMIARALVQEPEVIVLDEPTSHLDVRHKVEVIHILQKLCREKGITVILSLHDIDLAMKGCQTVLLVCNGEVIAQGAPEEIIKSGTIQNLYQIQGACFNELLGSLEFNHKGKPVVFMTGGNGTGVNLYRSVTRAGIGMYCGVLHSNDIDSYIGKSLGCHVIDEDAFCSISSDRMYDAGDRIKDVNYVVDTGFPVGINNEFNLQLLREAIECGKKVYSFAKTEEYQYRYGTFSDKVTACSDISAFTKFLIHDMEKEKSL